MDLESEVKSLVSQVISLVRSKASASASDSDSDSDSDSVLKTEAEMEGEAEASLNFMSLITQIVSLVRSMDLDSQPKPETEFISLIKRIISCGSSISDTEPEWELVSLVTHMISLISSADQIFSHLNTMDSHSEFVPLLSQILSHFVSMDSNIDSEFMSLIHQILFIVDSMDTEVELEGEKLISLSPQFALRFVNGKLIVMTKKVQQLKSQEQSKCNPRDWTLFRLTRGTEEITHFHCPVCNGEDHEDEHQKAPIEVKHPLHPRHSLHLVLWKSEEPPNAKCYCCDDDLLLLFYTCLDCHCGINITCVEKAPVLSVDHPKWHEHTLALFPLQIFLICNLCSSGHFSCPFYICPPCDFVAHQTCLNLPRVIKISRHPHRISFTPSFHARDWRCGVCHTRIHNDCGGYFCTRVGCSYAAHSKCATQSNIWDGKELEGTPEEDVDEGEVVEPFLRIGNGIIQHFSHQQHHLRLDENANRDYDENRICEACVTPIYFGNFYYCMQCDFILHEECANLPCKIHHPIHPHLLTLVTGTNTRINIKNSCSACPWLCTSGFFYECGEQGCQFKVHVQCAKISEPLVNESHKHPLFLTSKPGERRRCGVCKDSKPSYTNETFNCIECNFSLCFGCATIPQTLRYKHDKHMLTLSYGDETSTMTYWCEACETKINPKDRFYQYGEYCCVTLHIECLIGRDLYMKPGSSWLYYGRKVDVLPNIHCMTRFFCGHCMVRCPYNIVLRYSGKIYCSTLCMLYGFQIDV